MKIKKGDNVVIIAGKDRGKSGKVEKVFPKKEKLIVGGLNLRKHHQRPTKQGQKGQVVEKSMPMHISNVLIVDPKSSKPTRVGIKINNKGKRERISKKSGTVLN